MLLNLFTHPLFLFFGAITGFVLGFLIQKGRLSQFNVIVGQLLLRDFTMVKVMLTAILIGGLGVEYFLWIGWPVFMHIKTSTVAAVIVGGSIMGIGMAILGYCPGTCIAAAAQGSRDAWWGLAGMFLGAIIYSEFYEMFSENIHMMLKVEDDRLPKAFSISAWLIFSIIAALLVLLYFATRKGSPPQQPTAPIQAQQPATPKQPQKTLSQK